jgi:hypothetical protein
MIITARRDIAADTKPFSVLHEACLKHNRRNLSPINKGGGNVAIHPQRYLPAVAQERSGWRAIGELSNGPASANPSRGFQHRYFPGPRARSLRGHENKATTKAVTPRLDGRIYAGFQSVKL